MPRKGNGLRTRPAVEALAVPNVQFPPAHLSDFVIYYRHTAYHVHKFVLDYHSSYFRTYIEQLTTEQRAYPAEECNDHSDITHCIRLPDSCGKVGGGLRRLPRVPVPPLLRAALQLRSVQGCL